MSEETNKATEEILKGTTKDTKKAFEELKEIYFLTMETPYIKGKNKKLKEINKNTLTY